MPKQMLKYYLVRNDVNLLSLLNAFNEVSAAIFERHKKVNTYPQLLTLIAINETINKFGFCSIKDIQTIFNSSMQNTAFMMRVLSNAGLITIEKHGNRQKAFFFITNEGRRILKDLNNTLVNYIDSN